MDIGINQSLSDLSDNAVRAAFIVYLVALIISLFYYVKQQTILRLQQEREEAAQVSEKELAAVGAGGAGSEAGVGGVAAADEGAPGAGDDLDARAAANQKWAGATQSVVWLGVILNIASVVLRGFAVHRFPLGNLYEYVLMVTALTMATAAFVLHRRDRRVLWPWLLTPMLVLLFYGATALYAQSAPVVPALQSYWLPVHVTTVSIGGSLGIVSGVFSLLFLLRVWQPRGQEHGFFGALARPLPTATRLDEVAYRIAVFTLPILGVGIILGAIWAEAAWGRFWGWDPKETVAFVSWILYAAYLHARATAGWRVGAAWVNILAMATMVFNLFFINMVVSGLHSYAGLN